MLPSFNGSPNNQLKNSGTKSSTPQQVMGNSGSFCPNPMQIRPQFQLGVLSSQLAMPNFTNPNAYCAPTQLFPFPQAHVPNISCSSFNPMFSHNAVNWPQLLHNGQFNVPDLVQNMNQLLQMQMASFGPQNFANVNVPPSMVNGNRNVQHLMNANVLKEINSDYIVAKDFGASQQQNLHIFSQRDAKLQSNAGEFHGTNNNWKRSNKKNIGNFKGDASQRGFVKRQFHHKQYLKGNFKFRNANQVKGSKNGAKTFALSDMGKQIQEGKGRPLTLNYTEQEIQQWREQRKKNYPSKANMKKKLKDNSMQPEVTDAVANIRLQEELKEILEKQAELGCEVAEIPSCYLSDSERQTDGRVKGQNILGKRERIQNKLDKRGKLHQNDQVTTRHKPGDGSANIHDQNDCFAKKQRLASGSTHLDPSLLQKLLYSDIKRDRTCLLQTFRFMVMNSFFEDWPSKSVRFPLVIIKESGDESGRSGKKKYQEVEEDISASAASDLVMRSEEQNLQKEGEITI